jgi:uncharacterized protein (DUF1786 family)
VENVYTFARKKNMKHEIEIYKGHTIFYNEDTDKFYCEMVIEDSYKKTARLSLKAVKDEIDQFIKVNIDFKPFDVLVRDYGSVKKVNIQSVRKDGTFHVDRSFFSQNEMISKCYFFDGEIYSEMERLRKELDDFQKLKRAEIKALEDQMKPLTAEFLDKYKM